jgi:hypothetical protein
MAVELRRATLYTVRPIARASAKDLQCAGQYIATASEQKRK